MGHVARCHIMRLWQNSGSASDFDILHPLTEQIWEIFFFFFLVILFLLTSLSAVKPFDSFCVSLYRTVWFWCAHWLQPQTLVVRGEPFSLPSLVSDSITVLNCCHLLFQEDLFSKTRSTLQKYWDTPHFFIIVCFKGASLSFITLKCSWAVVLHVKCKAVGVFFLIISRL